MIKHMDCAANHMNPAYNYCPICGTNLLPSKSYAGFKQWLAEDVGQRRVNGRPFSSYEDRASSQYSLCVAIESQWGLMRDPCDAKYRQADAAEISRVLLPISDTFYMVERELIPAQFMLDEFARELRLYEFDLLAESNYEKIFVGDVIIYASDIKGGEYVNRQMRKICNLRAERQLSNPMKIRAGISLEDLADVVLGR